MAAAPFLSLLTSQPPHLPLQRAPPFSFCLIVVDTPFFNAIATFCFATSSCPRLSLRKGRSSVPHGQGVEVVVSGTLLPFARFLTRKCLLLQEFVILIPLSVAKTGKSVSAAGTKCLVLVSSESRIIAARLVCRAKRGCTRRDATRALVAVGHNGCAKGQIALVLHCNAAIRHIDGRAKLVVENGIICSDAYKTQCQLRFASRHSVLNPGTLQGKNQCPV